MKRFWAPALLLFLFLLLPISAIASTVPANTVVATNLAYTNTPAFATNQTLANNPTIPGTNSRYHKAFLGLLFALAAILFLTIARPRKRRPARPYLPLEDRPFRRPQVDLTRIPRRKPRIHPLDTLL